MSESDEEPAAEVFDIADIAEAIVGVHATCPITAEMIDRLEGGPVTTKEAIEAVVLAIGALERLIRGVDD